MSRMHKLHSLYNKPLLTFTGPSLLRPSSSGSVSGDVGHPHNYVTCSYQQLCVIGWSVNNCYIFKIEYVLVVERVIVLHHCGSRLRWE